MFIPPPQLKSGLFGARGPAAGPQLPGAAPPPKARGPKGVRIEQRVGIQAPAEAIWQVIADLPAWELWNPVYTKAQGRIGIGETLQMTLVLPGQKPQEIRPVVLDWVPNEQLHWRLTLLGGMVKTIRFIEIEQVSDTGCIVNNGEIFQGLLASSALRRVGRSVHRAFGQMNEALKARAESEWQKQGG